MPFSSKCAYCTCYCDYDCDCKIDDYVRMEEAIGKMCMQTQDVLKVPGVVEARMKRPIKFKIQDSTRYSAYNIACKDMQELLDNVVDILLY